MLSFINAHKTKIVGFIIVLLGAVQANAAQLSVLLSPKQYALTMVVLGCFVAAFGFINTIQANRQ